MFIIKLHNYSGYCSQMFTLDRSILNIPDFNNINPKAGHFEDGQLVRRV